MGKSIPRICRVCTKQFLTWPYVVRDGGGNHCSVQCLNIDMPNLLKGKGKKENQITILKNYCELTLKSKYGIFKVLFDKEDLNLIQQYRWCYHSVARKPEGYAITPGRLRMHRLILNADNGQIADHINGNGLDNRRVNLRLTDAQGNAWNSRKFYGREKYKGVQKQSNHNSWIAKIWYKRKGIYLGNYPTSELAAEAYNIAAMKYFGEYANINIINQ